jgi:CPA1 family monovalent cation:H+ antiporter
MIVETIQIFVVLLGVAALVAIVARPLRLPYSVALVAVGLLAGLVAPAVGAGLRPEVPPEAVLLVLLPGLVFEAGYRLDVAHLRRSFAGLLFLAMPGVLISAAVVAVTLNVTTGLRFDLAFIVGAMVSATDPAAVVSTFRRLRVPDQLATLVEGESLLNDGTGLVVFAIAIGALSAPVSPLEALATFVVAVVVSTGIGLAAGFVAARVMALVDDDLIELTISVVLAYGTYLVADALHESGVIATVVAAIVLGDHRRRRANVSRVTAAPVPGDSSTDPLDTVWEFLAYMLTALVFLLVGLAFPVSELAGSLVWILWGVVGILVGRALVIYVLLGAGARLIPMVGPRGALPRGWLHVMFWSGLRGAVAVAMALALPVDVPQRALLQQITFGIVLFTLIVQGMTAGALVRRTIGDQAAHRRSSRDH